MQIRQAKTDEVDEILRLIKQVVPLMQAGGNLQWNEDYPNAEVFQKDIANGHLWVCSEAAESGEQIIGVVAITNSPSPEYAGVGWNLDEPALVMHRLAVDPASRGKGVARALMNKAEELANQSGIGVLWVDTNSENRAMQRLLVDLGYIFAGEIGLNGRAGLRFYCYEKRLRLG